jgi:hypothetical protein
MAGMIPARLRVGSRGRGEALRQRIRLSRLVSRVTAGHEDPEGG